MAIKNPVIFFHAFALMAGFIGNSSFIQPMDYIYVIEQILGKTDQNELFPIQRENISRTDADVADLVMNLSYKSDICVAKGIEKFII